jgi:hypothetical protein
MKRFAGVKCVAYARVYNIAVQTESRFMLGRGRKFTIDDAPSADANKLIMNKRAHSKLRFSWSGDQQLRGWADEPSSADTAVPDDFDF